MATDDFQPVDQYKGGQERDGHREGDDADPGGQVERGCSQERLHEVHTDDDQPTVDQAELLDTNVFRLVKGLPAPLLFYRHLTSSLCVRPALASAGTSG